MVHGSFLFLIFWLELATLEFERFYFIFTDG